MINITPCEIKSKLGSNLLTLWCSFQMWSRILKSLPRSGDTGINIRPKCICLHQERNWPVCATIVAQVPMFDVCVIGYKRLFVPSTSYYLLYVSWIFPKRYFTSKPWKRCFLLVLAIVLTILIRNIVYKILMQKDFLDYTRFYSYFLRCVYAMYFRCKNDRIRIRPRGDMSCTMHNFPDCRERMTPL